MTEIDDPVAETFIPHGQGCEALVFTPDDWHAPCGDPARQTVIDNGQRRYVCDWHHRGWHRPTDETRSTLNAGVSSSRAAMSTNGESRSGSREGRS